MIHLSSHYKRLKMRFLKMALLAVFVSIFFMPSFVKFVKTGDNMFTVFLNGQEVGVVDSVEDAQSYAVEARRNVASRSNHLVLVESEIETVGQEVLWGRVDSPKLVINNMEKVYSSDMKESMIKSYVVKINEKIINLANLDEVVALLQAAVNKYDEDKEYQVELQLDPTRELPVMSASVATREEMQEQEEAAEAVALEAGFQADMTALFDQIEPDVEKDFEDYQLGIISMSFGDDIEVAEAYLDEGELTDISLAINEVTSDEEKNEIYKVVSGDTLSGIAIKTNVPLDKLIEMNESLEDENSMIRPDQELIVTVEEPMLAVLRQEEMYYEEDYDADVIYIDNDDWYTTETVVHQQPSAGHRKVVAVVAFENNTKVSEEIIKEEITYVAVPKVVEKDMVFYKLTDFSQLEPGYFGIPEPASGEIVEWPEALMIMPGVAFDRENHRVGYGGGFYDRYLEKHPQLERVAVAFSFQMLPEVPTEPTDICPQIVVTEEETCYLTD